MDNLEIKIFGDSVLRKKAEPVKKFDEDLKTLAEEMLKLMRKAKGVGLAANQVGVLKQLVVIDTSKGEKKGDLYMLVNPVICDGTGKARFEEGCLSFPEIFSEVERPAEVKVKALDINGSPLEINAEGVLARVLQHEIDHLSGKLFIDYIGIAKKLLLKKQLDALKKIKKSKG